MHDSPRTAPPKRSGTGLRPRARLARRLLATVVAVAGASTVTAVALTSPASAASGTVNVATSANFGPVLTNAQGLALYTFPQDVNGMSKCTGACAQVWPALTVPGGTTPTAGTGVPGTVAAVLQTNGTYQVTYNGSPLYTFVSDTSPGQVSGNGVGGFSVVKVATPPTTPTTATPPPTTSAPAPGSTSSTPTPTTASPPAGTATTGAPSPGSSSGPAVAATSGTSSAPTSASAGTAPGAPATLAATGFGTGLQWMVAVGVSLIALSIALSLLVVEDKSRLGRRTVRWASRTSGWLLGR